MKHNFVLLLSALFISCAVQANIQTKENVQNNQNTTSESVSAQVAHLNIASSEDSAQIDAVKQKEFEEKEKVPFQYRSIDFKNLSYQTSFRKQPIQLKEGIVEYEDKEHTGGDNFDFQAVDFIDLTGDGEKEAVVQLSRFSCGASCDGGSELYYIYSAHQKKLKLIWRIETGSLAYGCGTKSFATQNQQIILETFRDCQIKGAVLDNEFDPQEMTKFDAKKYTRLIFGFNGQTFVPESREVFLYSEGSVMNHRAKININND